MCETINFDQRDHFGNYKANITFLNETAKLTPQTKILEIGCGKGHLLNYFYKKGFDITGLEINASLLEESKKFYGKLPTVLVESEVLPFSNHLFDVVLSFDVFEHIPDSDEHLQEVSRVLRNGGSYLFQTPNKVTNFIFETIRWRSLTKWREEHCSLHNYWEIRRRFESNCFKVTFYDIPIVTDFFKQKISFYTGDLGVTLLKLVNPDRFPRFLKTNFYIEAKKMNP